MERDYEPLTENGGEVRTAYNRNGDRCIGWVIPTVNWRGRERWKARVERQFVRWHIEWQAWRTFRTREQAVAAVHKVLDRIEWTERAHRV